MVLRLLAAALAAALPGQAVARARFTAAGGHFDAQRSALGQTVSVASRPDVQPSCTQRQNSSKVVGGKVVLQVAINEEPELADEVCCDLANPGSQSQSPGLFYTAVDAGPSEGHPHQRVIICTSYAADPEAPHNVHIAPGNDSTSAGFSPRPAAKDPGCPSRQTFEECAGAQLGAQSPCAWWAGACHYDPPIECASLATTATQPFCINIVLAERPFTRQPTEPTSPGRKLRPFNWTGGTLTAGNESVAVMPPQLLREGQSSWWSVSSPTAGWQACVQYNELFANGSASDLQSGFEACLSSSDAGFDATRGTTSKLAAWAGYGVGIRGFSANESFWAQFVFWSNSTE